MCGIVGAIVFGEDKLSREEEVARQEAIMYITTDLLQQTQARGEDATGVATLFDNGMYMGLKAGVKAVEFINSFGGKETDYQGYLKIWRHKIMAKAQRYARIHIGHCRKTSVGNANDNNNNHPIIAGSIIGIHNGTLKNHETIFERLKCQRSGTVDSEAIMRLVAYYTKNGALPFTPELLHEVTRRLDGSFASLIMNAKNPYQLAVLKETRPVEFMLVRPLKTLFIASERPFLDVCVVRYNREAALFNQKFSILRKGDIEAATMAHGESIVFDLTKEVDHTTPIKSLYKKKTTKYTEHIWKAPWPATKWSRGGWQNQYNNSWDDSWKGGQAAGNRLPVTTPGVSSGKTSEQSSVPINGKVWNKDTNSFTETAAAGNNAPQRTAGGIVVTVDDDDGLNEATTNVESQRKVSTPTVIVNGKEAGQDSTKEEVPTTSVKVVDMAVNADALKAAGEHAKNLRAYEDEEALAEGLDIDSATLARMSKTALANKVKKVAYKLGFYDGYCLIQGKSKKQPPPKDLEERKRRSRERNIVSLKSLVKVVSDVLSATASREQVASALLSTKVPNNLLSRDLTKVISTGDMKARPFLKELVEAIQLKVETKEESGDEGRVDSAGFQSNGLK